jgi:NADH-quinone oxidoreductase subunit F
MVRTLQRLEDGEGTDEDLETILDVSDNIIGRAFCALGDAVPVPITSAIKYFKDEIIQHQKQGGCPFDPAASTAWAV